MATTVSKKAAINIDQYMAGFPPATQAILQEMRSIVRKAAPDAEETISYAIPAFKWNGMLVWFAGYTKHIGLYPRPSALLAFKDELIKFKTAKGSVQFPLDQPLPVALITRIVKFRMKENLASIKRPKRNPQQAIGHER